jgi:hypothetical protein
MPRALVLWTIGRHRHVHESRAAVSTCCLTVLAAAVNLTSPPCVALVDRSLRNGGRCCMLACCVKRCGSRVLQELDDLESRPRHRRGNDGTVGG